MKDTQKNEVSSQNSAKTPPKTSKHSIAEIKAKVNPTGSKDKELEALWAIGEVQRATISVQQTNIAELRKSVGSINDILDRVISLIEDLRGDLDTMMNSKKEGMN